MIYWDFDCTGKCGMDRYYASLHELDSNFQPARVFHSAFAVTSYYANLKQRMETLFQISSLWATHNIQTLPYKRQQNLERSHSPDMFSKTIRYSKILYGQKTSTHSERKIMPKKRFLGRAED